MLNVTSAGGRRRLQKNFNQFAAHKIGMSMFSGNLGHNRPDILRSSFKRVPQQLHGRRNHRRSIDERNHGRVAAAIEHLVQAHLQGTELSAAGVRIGNDRGSVRIGNRSQYSLILTRYDHHEVGRAGIGGYR